MPAAQLAVREGVPVDPAYQALSALGMDVSRDRWGTLYAQASRAQQMIGPEGEADLGAVPSPEYIQTRSTVTSTGFLQQTLVFAVDKQTGQTIELPYSIKTDSLISRAEAIEAAIVGHTLRAEDYNLDVLGAIYTGTFSLEPEEADE